MAEEPKRQFTGIFIPVEILDDPRLSGTDILLLAEIDALRGEDNEGCWASNAYLGKKVGISASRAAHIITKLRELGYVRTGSFDGRQRRLLADLSVSRSKADLLDAARQPCQKQQGSIAVNGKKERRRDSRDKKSKLPQALAGLESEWAEWLEHRKQLRKPMTDLTYTKQIAKLIAMGVEKARASIEQSIANGWTGLFEPRGDRAPLPVQLGRLSDHELVKRRAQLVEERNIIFRTYGKNPQGAVGQNKLRLWKDQQAIEAEQEKRKRERKA